MTEVRAGAKNCVISTTGDNGLSLVLYFTETIFRVIQVIRETEVSYKLNCFSDSFMLNE